MEVTVADSSHYFCCLLRFLFLLSESSGQSNLPRSFLSRQLCSYEFFNPSLLLLYCWCSLFLLIMEKRKERKTFTMDEKVWILEKVHSFRGTRTRVALARELQVSVSTVNTMVKNRGSIISSASECGLKEKKGNTGMRHTGSTVRRTGKKF